jgi:S1-C subfamily serine protease
MVISVEPESPAAKGHVRERDIIVRAGDRTIAGVDDLHRLLTEIPSGKQLAVMVLRGTDLVPLTVWPQPRN